MSTTVLSYDLADGIGILTLCRPQRKNAIDIELRRELLATCARRARTAR